MEPSARDTYDVALSYAGEDVAFVERVASYLRDQHLKVFFDEFEKVNLWGTELPQKLDEIYRIDSRYVVIFISQHYGRKVWPRLEIRSALARAAEEKGEFLLPARFDDTELPGLRSSVAFIDLRNESAEAFAAKVALKVTSGTKAEVVQPTPKPAASSNIQVLVPKRAILIGLAQYAFVPRGVFPMGSDDQYEHERPRHDVGVSSFFMAVSPVTNLEFGQFCKDAGYKTTAEIDDYGFCLRNREWQLCAGAHWRHPDGPDSSTDARMTHPVVQVSWFDSIKYCEWLSSRTGFRFELPTEAQWEYSAAGKEGRIWAFGNDFDRHKANLEGEGTTPIGNYAPNELGLYDTTGNVFEWCSDWYAPHWTDAGHSLDGGVTVDPKGAANGEWRSLRGGSWFDDRKNGRCANRYHGHPAYSAANIALRPCLAITAELLIKLLSDTRWAMDVREML
jgi:sulfatase modifying factor 1